MNLTQALMTLLLACGCAASAYAEAPADAALDKLKESHHIVSIDGGDNVVDTLEARKMIERFYEDQFLHFQDPRAPYFMMMSRSRQLAFGLGGVVRMRGWYDWDGAMPNSAFIPYNISIPEDPTQNHSFGTTPAGCSLFFLVLGNDPRVKNYKLYIEANFNGYHSKGFQLKKAYAEINDWTVGYTSSTFEDPAAQPPTVDAQGPNAECGASNVLLRWMHPVTKHWTVAASAETPSNSIPTLDGTYTGCSVYMPDFAAFVQYQWGTSSHVRLSGIVRGLEYRDLKSSRNYKVAGWGAHLSTVFRPVAPVTLYGACIVGEGIGSLNNDLQCGSNDLLGNPDRPGRMYAPLSIGWYAAMQYHFTPDVFSTLIFSEERFLPKYRNTADDTDYKYGLYATANLFWNITPRWLAGLEYNGGKRQDIDGAHGWANRVSLMAQFSF